MLYYAYLTESEGFSFVLKKHHDARRNAVPAGEGH